MRSLLKSKSVCSVEWLNDAKIWCAINLDTAEKVFAKNMLLSDISFDAELGVLSGLLDTLYLTTSEALKRLTDTSMSVLGDSLSLTTFGELKVLQDVKGNLITQAHKLLLTSSEDGYKILPVI